MTCSTAFAVQAFGSKDAAGRNVLRLDPTLARLAMTGAAIQRAARATIVAPFRLRLLILAIAGTACLHVQASRREWNRPHIAWLDRSYPDQVTPPGEPFVLSTMSMSTSASSCCIGACRNA